MGQVARQNFLSLSEMQSHMLFVLKNLHSEAFLDQSYQQLFRQFTDVRNLVDYFVIQLNKVWEKNIDSKRQKKEVKINSLKEQNMKLSKDILKKDILIDEKQEQFFKLKEQIEQKEKYIIDLLVENSQKIEKKSTIWPVNIIKSQQSTDNNEKRSQQLQKRLEKLYEIKMEEKQNELREKIQRQVQIQLKKYNENDGVAQLYKLRNEKDSLLTALKDKDLKIYELLKQIREVNE